jgi:hypothetical protein
MSFGRRLTIGAQPFSLSGLERSPFTAPDLLKGAPIRAMKHGEAVQPENPMGRP